MNTRLSSAFSLAAFLLLQPSANAAVATATPVTSPTQPNQAQTSNATKAPSFRRHVLPLLGRAGCNGRECHGSFSGQGGLQLSLFGYDFDHDFQELTNDPEDGSRIDKLKPEASLILLKPTMQEKHKGKERFKVGSWEYEMLRQWITAGAKNDAVETGDFDHLEILPKEIVFQTPGQAVQLRARAHWKDGTVEDVTALTRFRTNDDSVALVNESGRVESKGKGDTHIVAFYDNGVEPIPVIIPSSEQSGAKYPAIAAATKVDQLVVAKLRKVGIIPSERSTDAEFLRRVSLDLTGTLPTSREVESFLADPAPNKRVSKVEALLASPAYAAWWTTQLCDFTGNNPRTLIKGGGMTRNLSTEMSRQWYDWIYKRVAENVPYDQVAAGIVLATSRTSPNQSYKDFALEMGSYFRQEHPADFTARPNMPYYWQRQNLQKPEERALAFAHTFLGVRIECAQCHKHPFDQWTKSDFEHFQVFFAGIGYGPRPQRKDAPTEEMTYQSLNQELKIAAGADPAMMAMEKTKVPDKIKLTAPPIVPVFPGPIFVPLMPGALAKKFDGNKGNQKAEAAEAERRLRAGEPLPWPEVFVDISRTYQGKGQAKPNKANGNSRVLTPKLLGGEEVMLQQFSDPRQPLLDWLRDQDNPYFAKAFVNRVWASYFGRGIVHPADDLNLANAPTNGELLDYLSKTFVARGYDMKWLHREIVNSDTYQRSWKPNATNAQDEKNFSHAVIRRLPAEVAIDAISIATASNDRANTFSTDIEPRAIGAAGNSASYNRGKGGGKGGENNGYALAIFGKPARETNCDCERTAEPTLLQTLFTRNDPDFLQRLERTKGDSTWIDELRVRTGETAPVRNFDKKGKFLDGPQEFSKPVKKAPDGKGFAGGSAIKTAFKTPEAAAPANQPLDVPATVREVFLRTVSRPPTPQELELAKTDVAAAASPVQGIRDLLWAMLNSREFMVNH